MRYTCHGAAQEVTGSCHLIEANGYRVLLDCGLIQGSPEEEAHNNDPFPFDPAAIDAVILSHAHIDHSGRLPLLYRAGYRGPVYTHSASRDLCSIMLRDAAYINEREAERASRRQNNNNNDNIEPLFDRADAEAVMQQFHTIEYDQRRELLPGIEVRFNDAGHILGAAIVELWLTAGDKHCKLVYSGDIGFNGRPVLRDPVHIKHADVVIMESTYGDRNHKSWDDTFAEMRDIFEQASQARGNILIPAFAVGRTQALLQLFAQYRKQWNLDRWQLFLDSPMAIEATEVYFKHPGLIRDEVRDFWLFGKHHDVTEQLTFTRSAEESMRLNNIVGGAVIIAASGMCTGGRIRYHLKQNVGNKDCHIIIVGYQEIGTPGRALVDGAEYLRMWGKQYRVRARVHTIGGLSAHADQQGLLDWYQSFNNKPPVLLVHGEADAQQALSTKLKSVASSVTVMKKQQRTDLPVKT